MGSDLAMLQLAWGWLEARIRLARRDEGGQSTLEYVIIAAIISVAAVALVVYIVSQINSSKSRIQTQ